MPNRIQNREVFTENPRFGWQFFPPALARAPHSFVMPARKEAGTVRIFVLGESAALGDPEPAFGFSRILKVLLEERYPDKKFEVVNTAMTAINSNVILPIARECARHQGDLWVVYMGNNEVVGPFGPGTIFGLQVSSLALLRAMIRLKATKTGQLIDRFLSGAGKQPEMPTSCEGMKMFLDQEITAGDPRLERTYRYFDANTASIVKTGLRSGVPVILCTVASNVKDCPPFASRHSSSLSAADAQKWRPWHEQGRELMNDGKAGLALELFSKALALDSEYAELQYFMGRCYLGLSRTDEARAHFEKARDLDTLRFRADSKINGILRHAAGQFSGDRLVLVDAAAAVAKQSPNGLTGGEYLYEHVHFNFEGNYLLAISTAEAAQPFIEGANASASGKEWLTREACAKRLAYTGWAQFKNLENMVSRMQKAPFIAQAGHAQRIRSMEETLLKWRSGWTPARVRSWVALYQEALSRCPNDWEIHRQFAGFLEENDDLKTALKEFHQMADALPHSGVAYYNLGRIQNKNGLYPEAIQSLTTALKLAPFFHEAMNSMGIALAHQGYYREAGDWFEKAQILLDKHTQNNR